MLLERRVRDGVSWADFEGGVDDVSGFQRAAFRSIVRGKKTVTASGVEPGDEKADASAIHPSADGLAGVRRADAE
jgi:hypothetical protein